MAHYELRTPLSEKSVRALKAGDTVTIQGSIFGIRDSTLIRIFDHHIQPPVSLAGAVCLHTAPNVKKTDGHYEKLCIGTTTSARMERFTLGLARDYGVRAIVGKGGLLEESTRVMKEYGGCYLAIVGGAAALETTQIEEVEAVYWEDLMPECLWQFRVRDFGPLVTAIDSHGTNLYLNVEEEVRRRLPAIYRSLGIEQSGSM